MARAATRLAKGKLPPLVLMTDDERLKAPLAAAAALPRGSMIVVRARNEERLRSLGGQLLRLARSKGFSVLIAAQPELAVRLGAHGFHLPEVRAGEAAHWRARYPAMMITASAHSLHAVTRSGRLPLDAIFLSPVFATASHPKRAPLAPLRASMMARLSRVPIYALGGIDASNALRLAWNFAGIAAIGALEV